MKHNVAVIGSGNHHNTLGVIRALGEAGWEVTVVTIGPAVKNYVVSSRYVNRHIALECIDSLSNMLCTLTLNPTRTVVISCSDEVTEYLNIHKSELESRYIIPGLLNADYITELMDKQTMNRLAEESGIMHPQTWNLPQERQLVSFPCITKVHVSSHGKKADIVVCHSGDDLSEVLRNNTDELFAQTYINKKEEVQLIGCSLHAGAEVIIPGMSKILRSQPNTNTGFLEYGPVEPSYESTVEKAKDFIARCGYSGLFSFEVLRGQDDKVWFLEVNFRNDGNAWCVTKAGINLPSVWVKSCLGMDYASDIIAPRRLIMMPEFQDFKLVLQRKMGLLEWIKDYRRTDFFMEFDKNDPKPFLQYIINKIS